MYMEMASFSFNDIRYRRVIAYGEKGFFVCSYDYQELRYTRPGNEGGTIVSRNLDYLAIGATFHETIEQAREEIKRRYE